MAGVIIVGACVYITLCILVAWLGRNSRLGSWGIFISAIFFTPFLTFIGVILFGSRTENSAGGS